MGKHSKIKILYTIPNFDTAGSGKVVYDLVKGIDKDHFEIEIACSHSKGVFFETVKALGCKIHVFETKTSYKPYYSLLFRAYNISKFYRKQDIDIIHSWQWSNDWTEALAARLVGKKWMYTKKAMGFNKHWKIKSYLAHFIVTLNTDMKAYFPKKKSQKLIPLGIDTTYYDSNKFIKKVSDYFEIITVVNLVPVKGVEVLIRAIHDLNIKTIRLSVLGDYDNDYGRSMVDLCQELHLGDQVVFFGKEQDVRPYVVNSDLYVIPTLDQGRKEGMPMALVEAMSMGVCVLGSDITGVNYVLKDFETLLFPAGDVKALAQKIRKLMNLDPAERAEIGQNLSSYCKNHFAMPTFIKLHENLYFNLMNKK